MKALAKVLYEDQMAPDIKNFGPHVLVLRCVLERLGWTDERWYELERLVVGVPKKGASKLLAACAHTHEADGCRQVFAVFDADKVRELKQLGLSQGACKSRVREAVGRESPYADQLRVVLLEENMESIVAAVQRCKGATPTPKLVPLKRDSELMSIAWRADLQAVRACVLEQVPSLGYLVAKLSELVATASLQLK